VRRHLLTLAKLIVNAAACALALPLLLLALVLLLNPEASTGMAGLLAAWLVLIAAYGVPVGIVLPLAFSIVRFFAARPLRIGWFHLKSVVWFLLAGVLLMVGVYAYNVHRSGELLGGRGRLRLSWALGLIAVAWIAATALAGAAQWKRTEISGRLRAIALAILLILAPVILVLGATGGVRLSRSPYAAPEVDLGGGPVILIGIEGATLSEILPLVSEGRLPNFSRLLKAGASGPLRTVRPCRSASAWASLSTGKLPFHHGVKDVHLYGLAGLPTVLRAVPAGVFFRQWLSPRWLQILPVTGADMRARPIWTILDQVRMTASFVSWPLTDAPLPQGLTRESAERGARAKEWLGRMLGAGGEGEAGGIEGELLHAISRDLGVRDALQRMIAASHPRFAAAYLAGLGSVGSRFVPYRGPGGVARPPEEGAEAYGRVLDRYYEMLDQIVGDARALVPPEGYLVVVSAYGTEPLDSLRRLARKLSGLPAVSGGHDSGPAGILMIAGPGIAAGKQVDDLRVTDAVPLALYVLGAPVGRDMDGRLARRLFDRSFLEANPITFIPTYD
jgi:type I phosphodiesterase/nucleotide pyrophosphatase